MSCSQATIAPLVDRPPAIHHASGTQPALSQSDALSVGRVANVVNVVVLPCVIATIPGRVAPTANASVGPSLVPTTTGVPTVSPVIAAAAAVTWPAMSPGQASAGSRPSRARPVAKRRSQAPRSGSMNGAKNEAW